MTKEDWDTINKIMWDAAEKKRKKGRWLIQEADKIMAVRKRFNEEVQPKP